MRKKVLRKKILVKKIDDYEKLFFEKGYKPLEHIKNTKHKITCVDEEGYMYFASYEMLRDKRTLHLDRWKKQNIFKAFNMRLYAERVQDNCIILSNDEELKNASRVKIKFQCPECGRVYEKKWCHWIGQPKNCHLCQQCLKKESTYERLVRLWLEDNHLQYQREFWFSDCKDIRVLPFDFYIEYKDKIFLIEVDGCQHYYNNLMFNNFTLEERKRKDKIKTNYCIEKGYTLLRLPYWNFNNNTYICKLHKTFFG